MLKGKQKKLDVNKDGKISGKDFAILKAEKAKGRGMGLQDEELPPGKMLKASQGDMIEEKKYLKVLQEPAELTLQEPAESMLGEPKKTSIIEKAKNIYKKLNSPEVRKSMGTGGSKPMFKHGGSVIAKVKLARTKPTKLY